MQQMVRTSSITMASLMWIVGRRLAVDKKSVMFFTGRPAHRYRIASGVMHIDF